MASLRALSVDRSTIPSIASPTQVVPTAYSICQQEGALGLWRGTFATMLSLAPNSAVWWLAHEEAKRRIARDLRCSEDETRVLGLSGALAGISSTVATNPLDVVKTRLQCSETPITLAAVVRGVMQEEACAASTPASSLASSPRYRGRSAPCSPMSVPSPYARGPRA